MSEEEITKLVVQVQPNAGQNKVTGYRDDVLRIKIAAPPVKGRANQELIRFLSDILGLPRDKVTIEKGLTSRRKVIVIRGIAQDQVTRQFKK